MRLYSERGRGGQLTTYAVRVLRKRVLKQPDLDIRAARSPKSLELSEVG